MKIVFNRLASKLILTFTLTIVVMIVALVFVSYDRTNNILIDDFINTNKNVLRLVSNNFENYVGRIDELSIMLRKDERFMDALIDESWDSSNEAYIQDKIKNMFYSRHDLEDLRFYIPAHGMMLSISRPYDKLTVSYDRGIASQAWYDKTVKGEFFRYIEPMAGTGEFVSDPGRAYFTFHRALVSIPGLRPLGIVSLSFNRAAVDRMILDALSKDGEVVCLFDRENTPFYFSPSSPAGSAAVRKLMREKGHGGADGHFEAEIRGRDYLAVYYGSERGEWKMVKLIPVNVIKDKVRQIRNLSLLIGGIFLLLVVVLLVVISNTITGPLRRLAGQMDKVGGGNFTAKVEARGSYETIRLSERFNAMVDQIDQLINEKYLAQLNENTARLKALEAQINPHFLYNSLQAIATKAVMSGMKEISRMIEAFAFILRYSIKGGDQVRISEEIEHIRHYLLLQTARYEDRLSVEIEVEEGLAEVLIPKLSIQTLVENAVQHALENRPVAITIGISTYTEGDRIFIKVADNGSGMTAAHLHRVIAEMHQGAQLDRPVESIGLKNLYSRLKLMYGEEAGLLLESTESQGTQASIILPFQPGVERDACKG